jgi:hypothetical protein
VGFLEDVPFIGSFASFIGSVASFYSEASEDLIAKKITQSFSQEMWNESLISKNIS